MGNAENLEKRRIGKGERKMKKHAFILILLLVAMYF
jgi:hypothetical protein